MAVADNGMGRHIETLTPGSVTKVLKVCLPTLKTQLYSLVGTNSRVDAVLLHFHLRHRYTRHQSLHHLIPTAPFPCPQDKGHLVHCWSYRDSVVVSHRIHGAVPLHCNPLYCPTTSLY